jgi:hypothetical protein
MYEQWNRIDVSTSTATDAKPCVATTTDLTPALSRCSIQVGPSNGSTYVNYFWTYLSFFSFLIYAQLWRI